jgi:hypothetical protein
VGGLKKNQNVIFFTAKLLEKLAMSEGAMPRRKPQSANVRRTRGMEKEQQALASGIRRWLVIGELGLKAAQGFRLKPVLRLGGHERRRERITIVFVSFTVRVAVRVVRSFSLEKPGGACDITRPN